jgi:hypothetical protein
MACGGSQSAPADPSAAAGERLSGNWRLATFEPSLKLEEPIKGLVEAQLKAMTVSFSSGEYTATGPSVNASGRYEITSAKGDSLTGRIFDGSGAAYGVSGQFVGSQFQFTTQDLPWAGHGVLERAQ